MTDYIIIGILIIIIAFALNQTIKRLRGETSCCSGSTYKAHTKKLNHVVAKQTFYVSGMSCQHCVNKVMEAVQALDGASAVVQLKKGKVIVSMEQHIDPQCIKNAIERAGYTVTDIQ